MRKVIVAVLASLLLLALAAVGVAYWQASSAIDQLHAGAKGAVVAAVKPELHRAPKRPLVELPPEPSAQTILLIGSDHRWEGGTGARSDTIMLARVQPDRHRIALLSIPRDLYVEIPGHGHDRINMAFRYGGERLLTRVVRDTLGVEIDHFVEVDFHGFKDVVSALGGVWFPVDQRYFNENVGTAATNYANIDLQPGYQKLDGTQALAFARYRHDDSDLVRAARQQLLMRTIAHDALGAKWDILEVRRLAFAVAKATTSDIDGLGEVLSLARAVHDTPSSGVVRTTVSASDLVLYGADYLSATPEQLRATVRAWLGVKSPAPRTTRPAGARPTPAPPPSLYADGGRGRALLAGVANGIRTCAPAELPPGFFWRSDSARAYAIEGHPAIALYATAGSGDSLLWMFTTWQDPPILSSPTTTIRSGGRTYDAYTSGGRIHQLAWRVGATRAWLTNTLRDTLTNAQMLAVAGSCR
ncbi:MAG TPA: LCP family protein [Gaiellaceae bacterium]|nr:LCP family protein [Gaiellaceae bacterium]